jgi:hypothetical protein
MKARQLLQAVACAALIGSGACRHQLVAPVSWAPRFGPVIGDELIVGDVVSGSTVWLATGADALVRVDLDGRRSARLQLRPLGAGEHVWGLASDGMGAMWTLVGRTVLAQVSEQGEIVRRVTLGQPHVGLFGAHRELLYQVMNFHPPVEALTAGPPGGARRTWGSMRTRSLPLARGAVAALNLVSCGSSQGALIPCWFPDQAAVTLTDLSGVSREVALDGLPVVAPEVLLAAENPRRPVRDAFVSASSDVWVLGSGEPPRKEDIERPGGWLLARYDADGRLLRRMQLPEPARVILSATRDTCLLLSWNGLVVEVRP